jgi:hypothetical protein
MDCAAPCHHCYLRMARPQTKSARRFAKEFTDKKDTVPKETYQDYDEFNMKDLTKP